MLGEIVVCTDFQALNQKVTYNPVESFARRCPNLERFQLEVTLSRNAARVTWEERILRGEH